MEKQAREICRVHWLYGGVQPKGVIVKALNYDYYHEEEKAAGFFDLAGETPVLNKEGEMYFIAWTDASFAEQESYTTGHLDLAETLALASSIIGQSIQWLPQSKDEMKK